MDFFAVEVLTFGGSGSLLHSVRDRPGNPTGRDRGRRASAPCGWMRQIARNLTDGVDGFLNKRYVIHDRDHGGRCARDACQRERAGRMPGASRWAPELLLPPDA